ncbi:trifunctional serine/threonine-protein kinase/ATP-binding protein/sensor histidine kinase [Paraburkholderia pallida]|uniref:histidine kinase n=1 Tax=Paraburkholderia pallida TaxID=2547399 RepID=A0A4P7D5Z3_9BURK|nr:trifunctional serine/threonine-protein kinase/ATP-binding protein/sensor histidine kinase [Paraburkholderia pallida]QBR02022.1 GAF domain-containing protein [Paraburkholderia pallida]
MAESELYPAEDGAVWNEARYARAKPRFLGALGNVAEFSLVEPATGAQWRARQTTWAFGARCRQFELEYTLRDQLGPDWAVRPCALIRASDGPVLIYAEPFGSTLDELARGGLSIAQVLRFAAGMAHALAHLHALSFVHGDVRPANFVQAANGAILIRSFLNTHSPHENVPAEQSLDGVAAPYAAPERTGTGQTYVDERSDLYSLGVALFELLAGTLPFKADTAAQWLHAHLAIQPAPSWQFRAGVPAMLDEVIARLLAKEACERYQSAEALRQDLLHMQAQWDAAGTIARFEVARGERLVRAGNETSLIGRQAEVAQLLKAYSAVVQSAQPRIVLIEGAPGAGKTVLATEFRKRLLPASWWAAAKANPYQAAQPYAPVVQALKSLCLNVVGKGGAALAEWSARLSRYAGDYLNLLVRLVPEVELVVGRRHAGGDPGDDAPARRVQLALIQALRAFASEAAPLVVMLDDLQWADEATLDFIVTVAAERPPNLLLVAMCRSEDPTQSGPFRNFVACTRSQYSLVITLAPMTAQDVAQMISALIGEPLARVERLARIVQARTGGNPFHVRQLMRALFDERLIRFDGMRREWTWDDADIEALRQTQSVVDLISARLDRLAPDVREILTWLACMGAQNDEALLRRVCGLPAVELHYRLDVARRAGVLEPRDGGWSFVHDRVLEAVQTQADPAAWPARHAAVAMAMIDLHADRIGPAALEIAAQIELAKGAPLSRTEAQAFAGVLAEAAGRAIVAAARDRALAFLALAGELLGEDRWTTHYELASRIALLRSESLLAVGCLDQAAPEIDALMAHMRSDIDQAEAHRLKAAMYTVRSDYAAAVDVALEGLARLGVHLPRWPSADDLLAARDAVRDALDGRPIADLVHLPRMDDARIEAVMALLTALEAAMFEPSGLALLHFATVVRLTLQHGVTGASVQGLSWFGVYIAQTYGDYEEGFEYAQVALALVNHHGFERYRAATLIALDQVSVWTRPLSWALARAREAKAAGNLSAELRWMCYSCNHIVSDLIASGEPLPKIREEIKPLLDVARGAAYRDIVDLLATQAEFVASLCKGKGVPIGSWQAADVESRAALNAPAPSASSTQAPARMPVLAFWTLVLRGQSAFLFEDLEVALASFREARDYAWSTPAHIMLSDYRLYSALTLIYAHPDSAGEAPLTAALADHRDQLAIWAALNPGTFQNKLTLIDAEFARIAGNHLEAMKQYEASANMAAAAGFVHEQALAHELAGRHAAGLELTGVARYHLRLANACYKRWGALAKAAQLEQKYAFLAIDDVTAPRLHAAYGRDDLDFMAAMHTAQSLSEEIILERLIQNLMKGMIVHAGARYGLLLLMRRGALQIEATGRVVNGEVLVDIGTAPPTDRHIPLSILNTVVHTKKPLVFDDAQTEGEAAHAESLALHPARSVFCLPLLKQGTLIGVLYLENALVHRVFTPAKTAMLEVLAPQAANSLEAARLYAELVEENARRQATEAALGRARATLSRTAQMTVLGEMAASIAHEINQPLTSIISSVGAGVRWLKSGKPDCLEAVLSNLEDIRTAGLRAADIVRALRSLAKQSPVALVPLKIDDVLREMLELTAMEIDTKRVVLHTELNADLLEVLADRTQIQQVVLNLITNALDAMDGARDTKGVRKLQVRSQCEGSWVVVSVSDSGCGIAPDIAESIFEPFFTTKERGMGMGLAICQSIMEAHGGTLHVRDHVPAGSTFVFKLPIAYSG